MPASGEDRVIERLETRLKDARDLLATAERARDAAEPGSADYRRGVRAVGSSWMRVRRLEREVVAVRLAEVRR